ncbi:NAD(P)/FAD-dependent oxidoreductase [Candidatus Omnitrophota bacterium]
MQCYDIVIIGGGPAGLMAVIQAGKQRKDILLLERNKSLGKKLLISGKGRCNLTNSGDIDDFLENFSATGKFLRSAFSTFFNAELIEFFERREVPLKTERGGRVFPQSDKAMHVLNALQRAVRTAGAEIKWDARVVEVESKKDIFVVVLADKQRYATKRVILATGGLSYPATGSSGDGYAIAKNISHTVLPLHPGLVPLETKERWVRDLAGLSLKNVRLKVVADSKSVVSEIGEMLFTHQGISGPLVLTLSNTIVDALEKHKKPIRLFIDCKSGLSKEKLDQRLMREFKTNGARMYRNVLKELMPRKLIDVFVRLSRIEGSKKVSQITMDERNTICELLKALPLTITKSRPIEEAIVTRGGISTREIDPRTMESKRVKGMYFCGEMIDVDANTGGYNLQAAFSTGYLAGEAAARSLEK